MENGGKSTVRQGQHYVTVTLCGVVMGTAVYRFLGRLQTGVEGLLCSRDTLVTLRVVEGDPISGKRIEWFADTVKLLQRQEEQ
jgi:hypothetical protein